jgi:hypothetical protein
MANDERVASVLDLPFSIGLNCLNRDRTHIMVSLITKMPGRLECIVFLSLITVLLRVVSP